MKQKLLLKSMLLLFALIAGSSSVWADEITYNFTSKAWAAKVGETDANWTSGKDGNSLQDGRGVQVTTGVTGANATSPTSINNISKIVVTYSTNASSGAGSISFQVGSGTAKSQTVTKTGGTTDRTLTYNFSPNETGKVKITVSCTTNSIYVKSVTITYSDAVKEANGLAWSADSKDVIYSEEPYGLPSLTNPHSLTVTYDSSDKSVATIDSEGNVTIKNITGTTTISASTEGDATYAAGTVSYMLNVTRKVVLEDGVFNFGFGPSDGGDYGSGMTQGSSIIENESKTWTAGNVTLVVANRYAWNEDGKMVIYKKAGGANAAGSITISCPIGKAITQIEFTGPYSGTGSLNNMAANMGTYTVTSSSAIWTGAAQSVSFSASNSTYINTVTVTYGSTISITPAKEYTTLTSAENLDFTNVTGLEAYIATEVSGGSVLMTQVNKVPANTGLVLKATTPGSAVYVPVFDGTGADNVSANKMAGSATETTAIAANGGYILKDGVFQPALAGTLPAGKAYLNIAVPAGAPILNLGFDDATGIESIAKSQELTANGQYYNLAGQRVAQPTKGLYIVNGKKYIVK